MKKRFQLFLFILLLGVFVLPLSVLAEPKELTYETEISNWRPNNRLYITESTSFPTGTVVSWKLVCDGEDIALTKGSEFVFASVNDTCDSATFVETVNFDGITLSSLGLITDNTITPSVFDTDQSEGASLSTGVQNYLFSSYLYEVSYYPVHYYALNTVDENGNIIDSPYIRDLYFSDDENQKTTTQELGTISLPNYALRYNYQVKGNIANPNGSFFVTHSDNSIADIIYPYSPEGTGSVVPMASLTALNTVDTNPTDFITAGYGLGDVADSSYTMAVVNAHDGESFNDRLQVGENTFYLEYNISATLTAENSDTGLFYNLVPFIILIALGAVFGFFFFYKKKKGKQVIIDEEVL